MHPFRLLFSAALIMILCHRTVHASLNAKSYCAYNGDDQSLKFEDRCSPGSTHTSSLLLYLIKISGLNYNYAESTCPKSSNLGQIQDCGKDTDIYYSLKHQSHKLDVRFIQQNYGYLVVLLLIAGDTEVNPGPRPVKYPCLICKKAAKWGQRCLQCEDCDGWYHTECMSMSNDIFNAYANSSLTWICCQCGLPNISPSLFRTLNDTPTDNPFSCLNNTTEVSIDNSSSGTIPSDSGSFRIGSPKATSSPTRSKRQAGKNSTNTRQRTKILKSLLVNCDGLVNKLPHLEAMIDSLKPDVIIGTESHLKPNILTAEITPPGFTTYRKDRIHARKGGVFVMVRDDLITTECKFIESGAEVLYIELNIQGFKRLIIGSFYRPPNSDPANLRDLAQSLSDICAKFKDPILILGGDFNLADVDWTNRTVKPYATEAAKCSMLLDICNDFFLEQMVRDPTRISGSTKNILDIVLTSHPNFILNCKVTAGLSDHDAVTFEINSKPRLAKKAPRKIYIFSKANVADLLSDIRTFQVDWFNSDPSSRSVQENWDIFRSKIILLMDTHIPSKMSKPNRSSRWITNKTRRMIRKKQRLYNAAKQSGEWTTYKEYQKLLRKEIRHNYWTYQNNIFTSDSMNKNNKAFWNYIRSKKQEATGISSLKDGQRVIFDSKGKANLLNRQFQSVFTAEDVTDMPQPGGPPYPLMEDMHVTSDGVQKLLESININKATGPDSIPGCFLKRFAKELAPILTHIFQQSLTCGCVPSDWRLANVAPIFKKGDRCTPSNYRPVSITAICSKIMEHIIFSQVMNHYDDNKILHDCQHGFRPGRSCETQLVTTVDELTRSIDQREQVDSIVLDFSKAFDRVPHERLLLKLHHYGIRGHLLEWIRAFLIERSQRVVVDGHTSGWSHVSSGVPQGTVLGPLLFITYINDIPNGISSNLKLFADDCLIYRPIRDLHDRHALQQDLDLLHKWSETWQMKFNIDKCHLLRFSLKRNNLEGNYHLGDVQLSEVKEHKYLGVLLTNNLSWQKHINGITSKANQMLGLISRNLRRSSQRLRQQAYTSIVRPHVEYCATVWNPSTKKDTAKIEGVQRRAARFVLQRYHHTESVSAMINDLKWDTLEKRRHAACLTLLYKIQHGLVAINPDQFVTPMTQSNTRQFHPNKFKLITARTELYKHSYFPRTVAAWYMLPPDILVSATAETFQGALFQKRH